MGPIVIPKLQLVFLHYSFEICCISHSPITWTKENRIINHTLTYGNNFCISVDVATEGHTGTYNCRGINKYRRPFLRRAEVFVGVSDDSKIVPQERKDVVGQNAYYSCRSDASTQWFKLLDVSTKLCRLFNYKTSSLVVYNVTFEDSGKYICYGLNKQSGNHFIAKSSLKVLLPNRIEPFSDIVVEGGNSAFLCHSKTNVVWSFNGSALPSNVVKSGNTLHIHNANVMNQGFYTCFGKDLKEDLFYSETLLLVAIPIQGRVFPEKLTAAPGETVEFYCDTSKIMTWQYYGQSEDISVRFIESSGAAVFSGIRIFNISISSGGTYECIGNIRNTIFMSYGKLYVKEFPMMKIWVSPPLVHQPLGSRAVFLCEVDVDDDYHIEWKYYNKPLQSNVMARHNMELVIENMTIDNVGKYVCIAHSGDETVTAYGMLKSTDIIETNVLVSPFYNVVELGSDTNFTCTVESNVKHFLDWTVIANVQDNIKAENNLIYINSAVPGNSGIYKCNVRAGLVLKEEHANLFVTSKTNINGKEFLDF